MSNKLVLAEKPSVAGSIAAVLGANKREGGFFSGNGYFVSWCFGHLVELAEPSAYGEQYKRWSRETLPILPKEWKFTAYADKKKQLGIIHGLMNRADVDGIICATDAGREGQLIFQLVYDYCKCRKSVQRLWISSLEDSAIRSGFTSLRNGDEFENLYRAALCRSQADWLVGLNGTRLFSCLYNGVTLNVGRVQSPTLAMIVEREKAITAFTSEPFYTPLIDCGGFTADGERQKDLSVAESIRDATDGQDAIVVSVEKAKKTTAPPKLFDLTTLQREANRLLGYTAQQTLDYLQSLYERKLTTYPRVDSQYLTEDMAGTAKRVISAISGVYPFVDALSFVPDIPRVIDNTKVSDHHAIIPTLEIGKADLAALPVGERDLLSLIAARVYCAVATIHEYETATAVLGCGGHSFTAKGKTVLKDGWRAIDGAFRASLKNKTEKEGGDGNDADNESGALPELTEGQAFPSVTASVREGKSKPPLRFTEGSLLRAMETASAEDFPEDCERVGLGTPATRAGIIEKLIKTGFVERQKKQLVPSDKGMNLIAILPDNFKSPLLTAEWEQKLKLVENGELPAADFMDGIATLVKELIAANAEPIPEMVSVFASASKAISGGAKGATKGKPGAAGGKAVGKCVRCGSDVVESPKGFFCSSQSCRFALFKDSRFWSAKGKTLTSKIAATLLSEGRVSFSDLKSERTGKTYAATIILADDGAKTDFTLEFDNGRRGK
ncbi:DNA topoisomerase [Clostridia bacterium]|nr:DNA topoisomerase [Clostridia bacterium]